MRYFSHDTTASMDDLIIALRMEHGGAAVDAFWTILEYIYAEEKPLNFDKDNVETKAIIHKLISSYEVVEKYVRSMVEVGLLVWKKSQGSSKKLLTNLRAEEAIEQYHAKQETARKNGKYGGRPKKQTNNQEETEVGFSSVSKNNQDRNLYKTKTKTKGENTYSGYFPPDKGSEKSAALSELENYRAEQEQLEANAVPCPDEIKAIFDEVDRLYS